MVHFWSRRTRVGIPTNMLQSSQQPGRSDSRAAAGAVGAVGGGGRGGSNNKTGGGGGGGLCLLSRLGQYKRRQHEQHKRRVAERELDTLHHKIDKLLAKMESRDGDIVMDDEEECVVCLGARATMQTFPCQHRVVCRKCFIRTIQVAISQRSLPLRCVVCRARILKLRHMTSGVSEIAVGESSFSSPSQSRSMLCSGATISDNVDNSGFALSSTAIVSNNTSASSKRHGLSSVVKITPVTTMPKRGDRTCVSLFNPGPRVTLTSRTTTGHPSTHNKTDHSASTDTCRTKVDHSGSESLAVSLMTSSRGSTGPTGAIKTPTSAKKGDVMRDAQVGSGKGSNAQASRRVKSFAFRQIFWWQ